MTSSAMVGAPSKVLGQAVRGTGISGAYQVSSGSNGELNTSERLEKNDTVGSLNWRQINILSDTQNSNEFIELKPDDIALQNNQDRDQQKGQKTQEDPLGSKLFRKMPKEKSGKLNRDLQMQFDYTAPPIFIDGTETLDEQVSSTVYQDMALALPESTNMVNLFETSYESQRLTDEQEKKDQKNFILNPKGNGFDLDKQTGISANVPIHSNLNESGIPLNGLSNEDIGIEENEVLNATNQSKNGTASFGMLSSIAGQNMANID